jgi:hypothetical protein
MFKDYKLPDHFKVCDSPVGEVFKVSMALSNETNEQSIVYEKGLIEGYETNKFLLEQIQTLAIDKAAESDNKIFIDVRGHDMFSLERILQREISSIKKKYAIYAADDYVANHPSGYIFGERSGHDPFKKTFIKTYTNAIFKKIILFDEIKIHFNMEPERRDEFSTRYTITSSSQTDSIVVCIVDSDESPMIAHKRDVNISELLEITKSFN